MESMGEGQTYFPLFVSLAGKRIFMAGAGKIAARRAKVLLSFGAELFVAAPECGEKWEETFHAGNPLQTADEGGAVDGVCEAGNRLHYQKRAFAESDLQGMDFVLAATDDAALNHHIAELCKEKKIPVNNASCQEDCDFFFPAIMQEDGMTIGVSSGGSDHKKVAEVCGKLRRFFRAGFSCEGEMRR